MLGFRAARTAAMLAAILALVVPTAVATAEESTVELTATLDGKLIPLEDVSKYYCDDFGYPEIRCSVSPLVTTARATVMALVSSVDYVSIYDGTSYSGSMMNVSEDYPALSLIGWNDKISSVRARNSETGTFYVDWLYGGMGWAFCCNQLIPNLYSLSNVFSSVKRT